MLSDGLGSTTFALQQWQSQTLCCVWLTLQDLVVYGALPYSLQSTYQRKYKGLPCVPPLFAVVCRHCRAAPLPAAVCLDWHLQAEL